MSGAAFRGSDGKTESTAPVQTLVTQLGGGKTHLLTTLCGKIRKNVAKAYGDWCFERRAQLPPEWTAVDSAATEALDADTKGPLRDIHRRAGTAILFESPRSAGWAGDRLRHLAAIKA